MNGTLDQLPFLGHNNILECLHSSLKSERVGHAYVFVGQKDLGKTRLARYFLQCIACEDFSGVHPCQTCRACTALGKGIYADFYLLDRQTDVKTGKIKKNISVEQVKKLQSDLSQRSFYSRYKLILIHNAHTLSDSAANALLKSLEEPHKKTVFILLCQNEGSLPATVLSRCQIVRFHPVPTKLISRFLQEAGRDRKVSDHISKLSGGRAELAIQYYENPQKYEEYKEKVENFLNFLEIPIYKRIESFSFLKKTPSSEIAAEASGYVCIWMSVLRDIMLVRQNSEYHTRNYFMLEKIKKVSHRFTNKKLTELLQSLRAMLGMIDQNINIKLLFEEFLISI